MKEIIKKYGMYIQIGLSAFSLIALFIFPFVNLDYGYSVESNFNGFTMAMNTYIGYLLVLLPLVLIAAYFVPKYVAKKPFLSVVIPVACIVAWLLTVVFAKTFNSEFSDATLSAGAYATLISYILLAIYGFIAHNEVVGELIEIIKGKK